MATVSSDLCTYKRSHTSTYSRAQGGCNVGQQTQYYNWGHVLCTTCVLYVVVVLLCSTYIYILLLRVRFEKNLDLRHQPGLDELSSITTYILRYFQTLSRKAAFWPVMWCTVHSLSAFFVHRGALAQKRKNMVRVFSFGLRNHKCTKNTRGCMAIQPFFHWVWRGLII